LKFEEKHVPDSVVCKGVHNNIAKRDCHYAVHEKVLTEQKNFIIRQSGFNIKKHSITTISQTKIGLSARDTKRYICDDGISSFAFGHYSLIK
jgi:hypothetical protein